MKISDLERRLKRQLAETVASNDNVIELPAPVDYKAWQARYRKHIRCMIWWDELKKPEPKVGRSYFLAPFRSDPIYAPAFEGKGEWRTRKPNKPVEVHYTSFKGQRLIRAPALSVTNKQRFCGYLLLDGYHRIKELEPRLIVLDWIKIHPDQLCSIADTIGAWWQS